MRIILDTNVMSEIMRSEIDLKVQEWLFENTENDLLNTCISYFEIVKGFELLPHGKRKNALRDSFDILESRFEILEFDQDCASLAATFFAKRKSNGFMPISEDMMIAGICAKHGAALATRNVRDFEGLPIEVVNPWG